MTDPRRPRMEDYEVPDDEPLTPAEIEALGREGFLTRANMVHRASADHETPMEHIAAGKAQGRVRSEAEMRRELFEKGADEGRELKDYEKVMRALKEANTSGEDVVAKPENAAAKATKMGNPNQVAPRRRKAPAPSADPMGDRMRAWMAQNGAQHVREGFESYFTEGPIIEDPPAPSVVPGAPVVSPDLDHEIIDAEIVE